MSGELGAAERKRTRSGASSDRQQLTSKCRRNSIRDTAVVVMMNKSSTSSSASSSSSSSSSSPPPPISPSSPSANNPFLPREQFRGRQPPKLTPAEDAAAFQSPSFPHCHHSRDPPVKILSSCRASPTQRPPPFQTVAEPLAAAGPPADTASSSSSKSVDAKADAKAGNAASGVSGGDAASGVSGGNAASGVSGGNAASGVSGGDAASGVSASGVSASGVAAVCGLPAVCGVPAVCGTPKRPSSSSALSSVVHAPTASRFRHSLPASSASRPRGGPPPTRCVYPDEFLAQMMQEARRVTPVNYIELYATKAGSRVNAESRRLVIHYMLDVTSNIASPVSQFSAHMAAGLFDRYLAWSAGDEKLRTAVDAEMEVVGAACLYIASKLEDTWSLCLSDVCRTFDGGSAAREKAVLRWELRISTDFAFEFNAPTVIDLMHPMLQRAQDAIGPLPAELKELAFLAADEALLCAGCLGVAAHVVAAAALLIAITEVHGKAHRTANLPLEVRELLGADRKYLCAATGVLFHSLAGHPAFKAFKRRQRERGEGAPPPPAGLAALQAAEAPLSLSQESSYSLPGGDSSPPAKPRRHSEV